MKRSEKTTGEQRRTVLAALAAAALAACGGGGGGGGATPPLPTPAPTLPPPPPVDGPPWLAFGGDAQHAAVSQVATQPLSRIVWRTPVDMAPQYSPQGYLLVHYGSPVITRTNTVIVPVKRAAQPQYRIEARSGHDGTLAWSMDTDYAMPAHRWVPSYNITLTRANRLYAPGAGGKVYYRDNADSAASAVQTAVFYGDAAYTAAKAAYDASVFINTPITVDSQGNIYFGFSALPGNPGGLKGGIARIGADGKGSWAAAAALAGDSTIEKAAMNSAPALSKDEKTLYAAVNGAGSRGYLVALDAQTLAVRNKVLLLDPQTRIAARVIDDSTASPTIGPDGDVYFGVLETRSNEHNGRGWLLHFDATLTETKIPGSFGWDITASIVPAAMVPKYSGTSPYLIASKYNNYARAGTGDSKNRIAILDPNDRQPDMIAEGVIVMREVQTILGATPDPSFPGGFVEWCINTMAVDPLTKSVLANCEDGVLYRWDLATNALSEQIRLTSGLGESYTPTAVGADGKVYAINNAILFALGR